MGLYTNKAFCSPSASAPRPILTAAGEVFIVLAGRPLDPKYIPSLSSLQADMVKAGGEYSFSGRHNQNRRGNYRAITAGVTHGGGSKVCLMQLSFQRR